MAPLSSSFPHLLTLGAATPIHRGILLLRVDSQCLRHVTQCHTKFQPRPPPFTIVLTFRFFAVFFSGVLLCQLLGRMFGRLGLATHASTPVPVATQLINESLMKLMKPRRKHRERQEMENKTEVEMFFVSQDTTNPSPLVHSGRMQLRTQKAKMESG